MKLKRRILYFLLTFILYASCASYPRGESWVDLGSIAYGTDPNQFIEITAPKNNDKNVNVILYIHGYGNKMIDHTFLENYRDTYIIGKLDYRFLTHKKTDLSMDKLISDVHNGLKTLHDTVKMNGITVNKVIIIGNSLGATLALLYTYTFSEVTPIPIAFCVTMSGLTDLTDAMIIKATERFGKGPIQNYLLSLISIAVEEELSSDDITKLGYSDKSIEALKKISPIYYVNENAPPIIIVHNANDKVIPFSNGISLAYALEAYNVPHIFIQSVTNHGHNLGPNTRYGKSLVFAPLNARSPHDTPRRYTRKLHPQIEEKLVESINQYIEKYCLEQ